MISSLFWPKAKRNIIIFNNFSLKFPISFNLNLYNKLLCIFVRCVCVSHWINAYNTSTMDEMPWARNTNSANGVDGLRWMFLCVRRDTTATSLATKISFLFFSVINESNQIDIYPGPASIAFWFATSMMLPHLFFPIKYIFIFRRLRLHWFVLLSVCHFHWFVLRCTYVVSLYIFLPFFLPPMVTRYAILIKTMSFHIGTGIWQRPTND